MDAVADGPRIEQAWSRVRAWLEQNLPEVLSLLRPGASEDEIAALEREVGHPLPEGWSQLWKRNNGQIAVDREPGLLAGWWFLSTMNIAKEWKDWEEVRSHASPSLMFGGGHTSEPADAIEEVYSDAGWVPIAKEPCEGNYVGIDFNPGPAGRRGQIINFGRDEDEKVVLATGLPALIEWIADAFEGGRILVERIEGRLLLSHQGERLSASMLASGN